MSKQFAPQCRRILIVDDNVDAGELLCSLMSALGHDTRMATDGLAGLDLAAAFNPEIVFLDIGMPKISGFVVAERLRQLPALCHVCIAAVTGWDDELTKEKVRAAGFNFHIAKPARLDQLLHVVDCCSYPEITWAELSS